MPQELLLDELQSSEVLLIHLQPLERGDLIELEQQVSPEGILDSALYEGDRHEPFTPSDRIDLMECV
jgi:hypothetical protein